MDRLLNELKRNVRGPQSYAAQYLRSCREKEVTDNISEALKRLATPKYAEALATPEGQAYRKEVEAWAAETRQALQEGLAKKKAAAALRELQSSYRWVEHYSKRKQVAQLEQYKQTCLDVLSKKAADFAGCDEKQAADVRTMCAAIGASVPAMGTGAAAPAPTPAASPAAAAPAAATPAPAPAVRAAPAPAGDAPSVAKGQPGPAAPTGPAGAYDEATFAAVKKALEGDVRWMCSNPNLDRVKQYMAKAEATIAANLSVLEAEAVYLHSVRTKIAEATHKITLAAVKSSEDKIKQQRRWCTTHLQRGDQSKVLQSRENLVKAMEEQRSTLLQTAEGEQVLQDAAQFLSELDVGFEQLKLAQEAAGLANALKGHLRWVDTFLRRKDTNKASRHWAQAQESARPLLPGDAGPSPFCGLQAADAAVADYHAMAKRVETEVTAILLEQELAGLERQMKSAQSWANSYTRNGDVRKAMQHIEDLKGHAEAARVYTGCARAQALHEQAMKQVQEAMETIGPIQAAQEVAALKRPAEQTLYWLKQALDSKNEDKCMLLKENLASSVAPLDRYKDHPDATAFLAEVTALLARLDSELGNIIAEKQCKSLLNSGEAAYRWVEDSNRRKDARRTQVYLEQLAKAQSPLQEYAAAFPDAAGFLTRAAALQQRVDKELGDLLAEAEVAAGARRIDAPLRWFLAALESKRPGDIVTKRQRLVEAAVQLRTSRYSAQPAAAAKLSEVDAALARCEREMAGILAEDATKKVESKARAHMGLAKAAAGRDDARTGLLQLQALHRIAQPLRAAHGSHPAAAALLAEIDHCTAELEPKLAAAGEAKEAETLLRSLDGPLGHAKAAHARGDVGSAVSSLRKANSDAASLRTRFAYRSDVQKRLSDLDTLNLGLLGGIPCQREAAPSLEVDWRAPVAQQDALKAINAKLRAYEQLYGAASAAMEELDLDGTRQPPGPRWPARQEADLDKALAALKHVEANSLPALRAISPEHPGVALTASTLPELGAKAKELRDAVAPVYSYAAALYAAKSGYGSGYARYLEHQRRAQQPGNNNEPSEWQSGIEELRKAIAAHPALVAVSNLPDGYDNAAVEALLAELESSLVEAEARFRQACVRWHKQAAADQDLHAMARFRDQLRTKFPDAEECAIIDELHARVESVLAEEAAKREAERKAKREAYEQERQAKIKVQTDAWKSPFAGGNIETKADGKTHETWQYDGAAGVLVRTSSANKHTYKWVATTGAMKLLHERDNEEAGFVTWYSQNDGMRFDLRSECRGAKFLWVSYTFNAGTSTFEPASKANPPWKLDAAKGTLIAQGTAAEKFGASSCSCANVPPPLALFAVLAPEFLDKSIPEWVATERKKPRRCNAWIASTDQQAYLCGSCGFGSSSDNCCVCGKWTASSKYKARLCSSCGFASNADNCCKCGNWCASTKVVAYLCSDCGFGSSSDNCCKLK